uniref:Zinc transporter n=2 Tax=Chrysotila carterae TaxID=13221 RepID=A0A7S4F365_CHRCT|mmetsp:Transcript_13728/g.28949  ORF Transcript_13728/g.28949 Transcript_13728/m.28949 type:complete len:311 (-) Transcript_13728:558-1490(-)
MGGSSHAQAAFGMSFAAGLSTGVGALFVCFTTSLDRSLLAATMAFSAGVMIYVSLVEVIAVANEYFSQSYSPSLAYALSTLSFFAGVLAMAAVDSLVHRVMEKVAAHSAQTKRDGEADRAEAATTDEQRLYRAKAHEEDDAAAIAAVAAITERRRLLALAAVVSAAIVLHNIPEGMATYVASFHSVSAGLPLAIAIAIHNIPEGLAVAMPIYHATGSRSRAVLLGTLSGLSEPFGALLASIVANEASSKAAFGGMFGLTAGMMTYVCISELLPTAFNESGVGRGLIVGSFFCGCAVMALSLVAEKVATAS